MKSLKAYCYLLNRLENTSSRSWKVRPFTNSEKANILKHFQTTLMTLHDINVAVDLHYRNTS